MTSGLTHRPCARRCVPVRRNPQRRRLPLLNVLAYTVRLTNYAGTRYPKKALRRLLALAADRGFRRRPRPGRAYHGDEAAPLGLARSDVLRLEAPSATFSCARRSAPDEQIQTRFTPSRQTDDSPRVHAQEVHCGRKRVAHFMHQVKLPARTRRRTPCTPDSRHVLAWHQMHLTDSLGSNDPRRSGSRISRIC